MLPSVELRLLRAHLTIHPNTLVYVCVHSVCCCWLGRPSDDPQQDALLQPEHAMSLHANTASAQQQAQTPMSLDTSFMARQQQQQIAQQAPVHVAPAGATLAATLAQLHLGQYEDALRGLGVAEAADLQDLEEADCMELGMKKIEIKRLKRSAQ